MIKLHLNYVFSFRIFICLGICIHIENILGYLLISTCALVMSKLSKQYEIGCTTEAKNTVKL